MILGTVVAVHGRQYLVELDPEAGHPGENRRVNCFPRGKRSEVACGDRVTLSLPSADQGCIESIVPRDNLLYRSDQFRQKLIAANLTQVVIVVATEPPFLEEVIDRCLIAAENQNLAVLIVLNKYDLTAQRASADASLLTYEKLGYRVLRLSALDDVGALRAALHGQVSVLVGQSGMGKSTLINALLPEAKAATREISTALQTGKHTTTHATLYRLDDASRLIDSPGVQEFGLAQLSLGEIESAMPEFHNRLGQCRFRDCRHDEEPDCAIRAAVAAGHIAPSRLAFFRKIARSGI